MINVSNEKAKIALMKQTAGDINDNAIKLCDDLKKTSDIFQGNKVDDAINELTNHSSKIKDEASFLTIKVDSLNGVVNQIYQEQVDEENRRKREQNNLKKENIEL
jgi:hypothetical protein